MKYALNMDKNTNKTYTVEVFRSTNRISIVTGTVAELTRHFMYTLQAGASYQHERGNKKINLAPKNITALLANLNKASANVSCNGSRNKTYALSQFDEQN